MRFRFQHRIKIPYVFLVLISFGGAVLLNPFQFIGDQNDPFAAFFAIFWGILFSMLLVLGLWVGINLYAIQKANLILQNDYIEFTSLNGLRFLLPYWLRPFRFEYDSISFVKTGKLLMFWEISDSTGKVANLVPSAFEKNDAEKILEQLRKSLPSNRLDPNLEIYEPYKQRRYRIVLGITTAFFAVYLSTFLLDSRFLLRSKIIDAWNIEMGFPIFENSWIFSADKKDNVWVITKSIGNPYQVYNRHETLIRDWTMPDLDKGDYPNYISGDSEGKPIVWFDDRVLHYNDQWETISYKDGFNAVNLRFRGVVTNELAWFIYTKEKKNYFVNLDARTGIWNDVPLPQSALQKNLEPQIVRQAVNGDIMLLMTNATSAHVYFLSNNVWQNKDYQIVISNPQFVKDFFLDSDDSLWVLAGNIDQPHGIEKISALGELNTTFLPPLQENLRGYDTLFADSHGRVWVSGGYPYFVKVVVPVWGKTAVELVQYTEANSNYQGGGRNQLYYSNGKILSAGIYVSSVDSSLEKLPDPLSERLAQLDMNLTRLFVMIPYAIFALYNVNIYRNPNYLKLRIPTS